MYIIVSFVSKFLEIVNIGTHTLYNALYNAFKSTLFSRLSALSSSDCVQTFAYLSRIELYVQLLTLFKGNGMDNFCTGFEAKTKWRSKRDRFVKLKSTKTKSGQAAVGQQQKWGWFNVLKFLQPYVEENM